MTAYANTHPGTVFVDEAQDFFKVCNDALAEISIPKSEIEQSTYSFVHGNMNGFFTHFLSDFWNISVPADKQFQIAALNYQSFEKKMTHMIKDYINLVAVGNRWSRGTIGSLL